MYINRPIILVSFLLFVAFSSYAQVIHKVTVHFESTSFLLSKKAESKIDSLSLLLTNSPKAYRVEAIGHTDSTGGTSFNNQLSIKRASQVAKYYQSKGFLPKKTKHSGKGQSSPIASNNNELGKVKNRRVEITISTDVPKINSIGGIKIKGEKFRVNSEKGGIITAPSGTKIRIAPGTFVDSKGNVVKGNVDIVYREYRNPTDFIFSDIPMSVMQNGKMYPFNSAGMFKIRAFKNGESLTINEGKKINIDFAVTEELANMNFYRFDEENNHWAEQAQLTGQNGSQLGQVYWMRTVCQHIDGEKVCSMEDCDALYFIVQKGTLFSQSELSISQQLQNENELKSSSSKLSNILLKDLNSEIGQNGIKQIDYSTALLGQLHKYQITKTKVKKGKSKLSITCEGSLHNEYIPYENIKWEYSSKNQSIPDSIFSKTWTDCKLTPNKSNYQLDLTENGITYTIENLLLIPAEKVKKKNRKKYNVAFYNNYEENMLKYKAAMNQLSVANDSLIRIIDSLKEKRDSVQTVIDISDSLIMELHSDSLFCFWDNSKTYMTDEENKLDMNGWLKYFDNNKTIMVDRYNTIKNDKEKYDYCARMARLKIEMDKEIERNRERLAAMNTGENYEQANNNANIIVQSLSISALGIYNCDQVGRLKNPVTVIANYEDENGNPVEPLLAFLIDDTFNGMLRYDGNYGLSPYVFAFSPTSGNTLIVFDENSNTYIYRPNDFKQIENIEDRFKHTFKVEKIKSLKSKDDLLK